MRKVNHIVVFSHGFGVEKDDRGLFADIASAIQNINPVLFDYNDVNKNENTLTVRPLSAQAKMLQEVLSRVSRDNPDATIDLVCNSQGCLIAAIAEPLNIRKTVFLAPSLDRDIDRMIAIFKNCLGSEINTTGISKLARQDGSVTIVPPEYWTDQKDMNPIASYNKLSERTELIIIANQDEILEHRDTQGLSEKIKILKLDANHNFKKEIRKDLLVKLEEILTPPGIEPEKGNRVE